MGIILKSCFGEFEFSESFYINLFMGIYQNIADRGILQEGFQGPKSHDLVLDFFEQPLPLIVIERDAILILHQDSLDQPPDLLPEHGFVKRVDERQIDW